MKKTTHLHIISILMTALLLLGALPAFALGASAETLPVSAYSAYLFRVTADTAVPDGCLFMNHANGKYLGKISNIDYVDAADAVTWTLTQTEAGYTVRRADASSSSSTAAFSFGSSNRIGLKADSSASAMTFYELMPGDKFQKVSAPLVTGKDYLIVYDDGTSTFAMSNSANDPGGSFARVNTYAVEIPAYVPGEVVEPFYAKYLFAAASFGGGFSFYNASADAYLTKNGNANMGAETAFTLEVTGSGVNIVLDGGNSLHFGSNNSCSFGTASSFVFYEQIGDELFTPVTLPEDGKTYLIVHPEGDVKYVLSNEVTDGPRVQTYAVNFPIEEPEGPEEPFDYSPYIFIAGSVEGGVSFYNEAADGYLTKNGNANIGEETALVVIETETGVKIRLASDEDESTGFLHFGSSDRCSFGTASEFVLYEQVGEDSFAEVASPTEGKSYLIVCLKNGVTYALSNEVWSSGSSARIQTRAVEFTVAEGAYAHRLWKFTEDENGNFSMLNAAGKVYLSCGSNAEVGSSPVFFEVSPAESGRGVFIALAEDTGAKSAGDALHCGSGQKCSFGTGDPFILYEFVGNDTFREVSAPQNGRSYLVVFEKDGGSYALIDTAEGGRVLTQETPDIPLAPDTAPQDLNGDGSVDISDVTALLNELSGAYGSIRAGSPDLNGDSAVDISDVTALLNFLAG